MHTYYVNIYMYMYIVLYKIHKYKREYNKLALNIASLGLMVNIDTNIHTYTLICVYIYV